MHQPTQSLRLPYRTRNPKAFEELAHKLVASRVDCGAYSLDCSSYKSVDVVFTEKRVYDKLSGLKLRLRIPVLVFRGDSGECIVEARWTGDMFVLDCNSLEKCCRRI